MSASSHLYTPGIQSGVWLKAGLQEKHILSELMPKKVLVRYHVLKSVADGRLPKLFEHKKSTTIVSVWEANSLGRMNTDQATRTPGELPGTGGGQGLLAVPLPAREDFRTTFPHQRGPD